MAMKSDSLKREVALLYVMQQMREEMDLAWKDFFEKNPGFKEEDVWGRIEERLRSVQNSTHQDKGVLITAQNALRKKLSSEFRQ
jgi:hypothetical protein